MNKLLILLITAVCWSCSDNSFEKHQKKRDNSINVKDRLKEIPIDDVLIYWLCDVYTIAGYLLIADYRSYDKQIHLFNKNTFTYVTSTAPMGQGPEEITRMGPVVIDEANRCFFVTDYGKNKIFAYELDRVLTDSTYAPEVKMGIKEQEIPSAYDYINDTLSIATIVKPTGDYGFNQVVAKFNMQTGEIKPMENLHPEIERLRVSTAVSLKHGIYIECYHHHNLLCIRTLDGDLKYNIYGRPWDTKTSNKYTYFGRAVFCRDRIIVSFLGDLGLLTGKNGEPVSNWSHTFMVFDINGDYLKTLDIGYEFVSFCYDEDNHRLLLSLRDKMQFASLDLDGIID
jgi:hypothetical protein